MTAHALARTAPLRRFDRLLAAGALLLCMLIAGPVLQVPLHIPINYNEGWNAGFDARAVGMGNGPLYPGPDTLVFNNYPPLGFLLVGAAGLLCGGDMILTGRVVALLSLLGSAALLALCARRFGCGRRASAAAALLMLLVAATFFRGYVAMDDPQWLAHAVMLAGLAVLLGGGADRLRDRPPPAGRIVAACLLVLAGGFIKHNLVALPLAVTIWLFLSQPRAGLIWIAAASAGLALGAGLMALNYGPASFHDILEHRRVFRVHLLTHAISRLAPLLPALLALCWGLRRRSCGPGATFAGLFASIALVAGTLQRMGEGVYYNAHFEAMIGTCLGFALVLDAAITGERTPQRRRFGPAALLLFAASPVLGALPWHLPIAWHAVADRHREERAWRPVIAQLAAAPGDVGCNLLSLCVWAGKPFELDSFNLTQSVIAGGPTARFDALVDGRALSLFEDDPASFLHTDAVRKLGHDPIMDRFHRSYTVVAHGPDGIVLLAPGQVRDISPR